MLRENGPLKALVIGVGRAGERHAAAQKKLGVETFVFDKDQDHARSVAERHGLRVALTLEEALAEVDLVHICTPDHIHTDYAVQSIEAGKSILSEKPLTTNLHDAQQIHAEVVEHGTEFFVGTNYRLTPSFLAIESGVQNGELGTVLGLETTYVHDMSTVQDRDPWRRSGEGQSFLYGGGIHPIDLAMWIAKEPVTEVQATTGELKVMPEYKRPEDYHLTLRFASGILAHVWLNAAIPLPDHGTNVRAYGTDGAYNAHNKDPKLYVYKKGNKEWESREAGTAYTVDEEIKIINEWLRGERNDHRPIPNIDEAMRVMYVMEALERAIASGKTENVIYSNSFRSSD